ncbi:hypothetical protein [Halobacillus mangrovi]|uniref:Uncharacterized protein n=1 Tax=Halobacillus mangrovi TaxID=402384 RepID=A0A1W5ZYY5_9BACI|nr:hypothetical protein [Halobacillus mangrovi]ARI78451.1 hypothetical protein HM131_17120 [Halobacillus mangrovi]
MMDLINLYVYEVTRRLPEKMQDDIALELKSTIHDMLPDGGYNEKDVKQVLETLGNPATLASRYKDSPSHLIGSPFYESYLSVLKITLPIALTVALLSLIAAEIVSYDSQESFIGVLLAISGKVIRTAIEVAIQTFFWITITFIVIERTVSSDKLPDTPFGRKWTPEHLKETAVIPKKRAISRWEVFFGLLWTAIWATVYFKASHLIAIYMFGEKEGFRQTIPLFNEEILRSYWPFIVLLIGVEVALSIYKWLARQWTNKLAVANLLSNLLFLGVLCLVITNDALFSTDAMAFMSDSLNNHADRIVQWAKLTLIITFVVITGLDSFEGFRKANKGIDLNKKLDVSKL